MPSGPRDGLHAAVSPEIMATETTEEAAPPAHATFDIRGTATLLDPSSPNPHSGRNPNPKPGANPPLLNLPPEIRHQIWAEILSGNTIHLEVQKGSLRGTKCIARDPSKCHDAPFTRGCRATRDLERSQKTKPAAGGKLNLLPLLLTCKLIYTEAITIIYTTTTFTLLNLSTLHSLPPFLPSHLHSIRTLLLLTGISPGTNHSILPPRRHPGSALELDDDYVVEWAVVWRMLASMQGLRALDVEFVPVNHAGFFSRRESSEMVLEKVGGGEGGRASIHLPRRRGLWWRSTVARSALAALEGVYGVGGVEGLVGDVAGWAEEGGEM